jgi:transcriptional regulator with XRE-family HTH domain
MVTTAPRQTRSADPSEQSALRRLGELFQRAQLEKRLSERELGKLAGVSRTHLRFAISGGNITILMLLRLTRALQIPSRALSDLGLPVVAALRHIEEAASHLSEAAAILGSNDSAKHSEKDDTDARAAALVGEVMAKAKTLGADRLSVLGETLRGLVASAEQPGAPAVREKRSGTGWHRPK